MNDWLKKQQRKKIPYGFFKAALDSRKEVSVGGLRRISTSCSDIYGSGRASPCHF